MGFIGDAERGGHFGTRRRLPFRSRIEINCSKASYPCVFPGGGERAGMPLSNANASVTQRAMETKARATLKGSI
jgi:hypothetical protein